ncbi:MAG: CPBP family intramembrane metalloprotease [Anaerolineaceae bacterium]|nr:CPBP family intramembrane metalloprotease [Anaerolineaceae bacterium]
MTTLASVNSLEAAQSRLLEGRIPRYGPMLMLLARPTLLLLVQGIVFMLFRQLNVQNAGAAIRSWWTVFGTLVDLGCLGLLIWLTRREGIGLRDLIGLVKSKLKFDIPLGLGIFVIVFPLTVFGGGMLAMLLVYGRLNPIFPEGTYIRTLPLLAVLYSRILWWPLWSFTEEMTYNGYALPRLIALTRSPWLSVLIVSFFYSIQHSFLALAGFQYGLYMFLTFIPLTIALELIYLRVRRLPPLIIGHWLMDLSSVLFMLQVG